MPDRAKVVEALECLEYGQTCACCDYQPYDDCSRRVARDTLALLKEQEAENVVNMTLSKDKFLIASCPKCNMLLTRVEHKNYCGYCGQAVKWE